MSAFASAISATFATLKNVAGETVSYLRGGSAASLMAVPGQSTIEIDRGNGAIEQILSSDWIVFTSELVVGGVVITPRAGDRITRTIGGVNETFEVMTPPYRPCDAQRTRLRIHSKRVG